MDYHQAIKLSIKVGSSGIKSHWEVWCRFSSNTVPKFYKNYLQFETVLEIFQGLYVIHTERNDLDIGHFVQER